MSAGGLEAATAFLKAMPPDSGLAFVIVQHLDPTRESMLADLLGRETTMPVVQIVDGMRVEPNRIHVIIPAKTLLIRDGVLALVEPSEPRGHRHPIDRFFSALADDRQERAIAIILSGAGSNGTAGLQDIKQGGGMCVAQDPLTAKFDSMPRHAIASDVIDYVLAPGMMPDVLLRYARHSYVTNPPPETISDGSNADLNDVLVFLQARAGHDFRQYKRNTLSRRIRRRMSLARTESLDDYLALLSRDFDEVTALAKDLMINVTAFFRDSEAWAALDRDVITPLVAAAEPKQTIRVWVPACSTGEEAYTIAMLLAERCEAADKELGVKIFATDAAEHHLGAARKATFPGSMVESLSPERLHRFFDKEGDDNYRVKSAIRETVLFAPQNLLLDPPYSRMDLVSCRNLLIYLEPDAQDRVLSLAHFALREEGYLFLGNAETVAQRGHLFATISKRWRIYRRVGPARSAAIDFTNWPRRDHLADPALTQPKLADIVLKSLAERFAPASVLIDPTYRVLHFHGQTEHFLAQPPGPPTLDLLALARDGLRLAIRAAVRKAIDSGGAVVVRAKATIRGPGALVSVAACPVGGGEGMGRLILVSFAAEQTGAYSSAAKAADGSSTEHFPERDFEEELRAARDEMRINVEQFETTNEELTAANEEITSVNEELQATNEELEASKEELQSLNEELNTVNSQLDRKVAELEQAGDDLKNLLMGNEVATIFLDTQMRIKWFTPAVRALFDLIDKDVGRPIANFTKRFTGADLIEKARRAVEKLATFEEEIGADDGRQYLLRILPYRTRDNRIAGAVATFVDISALKAMQTQISAARDYAEGIVETVRDPLAVLTTELRVRSANVAFYALFGATPSETEGQVIYELDGGQWDIPQLRVLLEEMLPKQQQINNFEIELAIPGLGRRCIQLNARRIDGDRGDASLILLALEDITERKDSIRHQTMLIGELSHRVKNMLTVVQSMASQTLRNNTSLDNFYEAFSGRLEALARANDAVIEGEWKGVKLGALIQRALGPFGSTGQVVVSAGPPLNLHPKACLALAMILHELATNALKYGALSVPTGHVTITWRIESEADVRNIAMEWIESGGPGVEAPARRGQGTKFIERSAAYELRGKATMEFGRSGLRAQLLFPLEAAIMLTDGTPDSVVETVE